MYKFNARGMIKFPNPHKQEDVYKHEHLLVIGECYCPKGHNLVSSHAWFNDLKGIVMSARKGSENGTVSLSPVYGEKNRMVSGFEPKKGELYDFFCPYCDTQLPSFSGCECGGRVIALFLNPNGDYSDCVGFCSRMGCTLASIRLHNEMISDAMLDSL
jgi:hypothetical protein